MAVNSLSGGEKLEKYLNELSKKVSKAASLNVGFMEDKIYPDGTQVAAVAAFNEYGVPSHNQPPRPFFRRMIAKNNKAWGPMLGKLLKKNNYDLVPSLDLLGEKIGGQLEESITEFTDPPLAQSTIDAKGFPTPLQHTELMKRSISHKVTE